MAQIDPNIALATSPQTPVQVMGPAQVAQQGLTLQDLYLRNQQAQGAVALQAQQVNDQKTLASLYKSNTNPDGTINAPGIVKGLGDAGSGHLIPAFQTQQQALAEKAATTAKATADAASTSYGTLSKSLEASSAGIGALLANPGVGHDDVVHQLATQVKNGTLTLEHAQNTIADMPPSTGNPAQDTANLKNWLLQQNLKISDAKTRLDATTAKPTAMNNGKVTTMADTNPITNPGIVGATMHMTTTPGEDQSAAVAQRGQNLTFQTANNSVESTPGGIAVVNKATNTATPVVDSRGFQALPAASPVFKNQQTYAQMQAVAQQARDLLNDKQSPPTHSTMGAGLDAAGRFIGVATDAADKAAQLKALGGALTASIPRMEGPQSDADRNAYAAQAGNVGDESLPLSVRLHALNTVMNLQSKYAAINGGNGASPVGATPVTVVNPNAPPPGPPAPGNRPPIGAFNR